jgi:hypothetical protein
VLGGATGAINPDKTLIIKEIGFDDKLHAGGFPFTEVRFEPLMGRTFMSQFQLEDKSQ